MVHYLSEEVFEEAVLEAATVADKHSDADEVGTSAEGVHDLTTDVADRVVMQWSHNLQRGVDCLRRCLDDQDIPVGRELPYEMSLVNVPIDDAGTRLVTLVHWSFASTRMGRQVDIRDGNRAVCPALPGFRTCLAQPSSTLRSESA